ncbi:hypothetical protein FRC09_020304 [Ceratobasidium sp. 395]|nr:hypothetical protein FRC09_020304 [Ceratobasidium sp. 395]
MSSQQPQKRSNDEAGSHRTGKKPKHKKTPSDAESIVELKVLIQKFGNVLADNSPYSNPEVCDISKPLWAFHGWLNTLSKKELYFPPPELLRAVKTAVDHAGSYMSPLGRALDQPEPETTDDQGDNNPRRAWSYYARERYGPMVAFAKKLAGVKTLHDQATQVGRIYAANAVLQMHIDRIQWNNKLLKKKDSEAKHDVKILRNKVQFLISTHRIVISRDVDNLSMQQLLDIVERGQKFLHYQNAKTFTLKELAEGHECPPCLADAKVYGPHQRPKYPSPPDGTPQIPNLFPHGAVTLDEFQKHRFRLITGGTCFVTTQPEGSEIPELALFIDFIDYEKESVQHKLRLERLAYLLHLAATFSTPCESNKAHQAVDPELHGFMGVLGHRQGLYTKIPWGMYAPAGQFKKKRKEDWVDFQKEFMPELAAIINVLFLESAAAEWVTEGAMNFVFKYRLPPFGATSTDEDTWMDSAGCSLTVSFEGKKAGEYRLHYFSNECHLDQDKYPYVFSVYVFVDKLTGKLITDPKRIQECIEGGFLIWPDLHLALEIVHCTGVVMLFWRGTHERHGTILSEVKDDTVRRIGTSLQVNKRLFGAVQNHYWRLEEYDDWVVNGMEGAAPERPELPTDLSDYVVMHE